MTASRWNQIVAVLKALPMVRFALMLGGGVVATLGASWIIALIGHGVWPAGEAVAIARINSLAMLGAGALALIGIVFVALAWGQLGKLNLNVGGNSVELDFDEDRKA